MRHITTHDAPATGLRSIADTSWHVRGACHGMDIEDADAVFFPGPRDHEEIAEAKELCGWCPVRRACLDFALENVLKRASGAGSLKQSAARCTTTCTSAWTTGA